MEELALQFFPFPHVADGERRPGSLIEWPERCGNCDRQCESASGNGVGLCSYGLNYLRIDESLLVAGIVLKDYPRETPARRKMLRQLYSQSISREDLERVAGIGRQLGDRIEAELSRRLEKAVDEYRRRRGYLEEVVERIRPEMEQALAQVHDYKQFVQQVVQNMDVLLEERFPGLPLEVKIRLAKHEEAAIYWAAEMMDEKLEAIAFLQYPDRIRELSEWGRLPLYDVVSKYVSIYQRKGDRRRLDIVVTGLRSASIRGNVRALGIIPHTLIDNAIKYAPSGTKVEVTVEDSAGRIEFVVRSFGPKICEGERKAIFDPFVRGQAAKKMRKEGTGFGLAAAQTIAHAHNTEILVEQSAERGPEDTHRTTFRIVFEALR